MRRAFRAFLFSAKLALLVVVGLSVAVVTGHLSLSQSAEAQLAQIDCPVVNDQIVCDVCPNLPEYQPAVPEGYHKDNEGDCVVNEQDLCWNIDGMQSIVPDGFHVDESQDNACVEDPKNVGEVLGDSTEVTPAQTTPQVLADETGK